MTDDIHLESVAGDGGKGRVEKWLRENGVALEMQVASAFLAALRQQKLIYGDVDLGRTYVGQDLPSDERKRRETDVVVQATRRTSSGAYISVWLIIECKSSVKDPWVLYRSAGHRPPPPQSIAEAGWDVRTVPGLRIENIDDWFGAELMATRRRGCYSAASTNTKDTGGNQKNHARDALLQVSSALEGVAEEVEVGHAFRTAAVLIPVIITAAPLFVVSMSENRAPQVESTTHEVITTRLRIRDNEPRSVWIASVDWIDGLVAAFMSLVSNIGYSA